MKRIVILIAAMVFYSSQARAADIVLTVPDPSVARIVELCEELRQTLRISTDSALWSNELCATEVFRIGMREVDKRTETKAAKESVYLQVNTSLNSWDASYPRTPASFCSDSVVDTEYGEQCDDGNEVDGDGCDSSCQTE